MKKEAKIMNHRVIFLFSENCMDKFLFKSKKKMIDAENEFVLK